MIYYANGDEHKEDGTLDESPETALMMAKRIRKLDTIRDALPDPRQFGDEGATIAFI